MRWTRVAQSVSGTRLSRCGLRSVAGRAGVDRGFVRTVKRARLGSSNLASSAVSANTARRLSTQKALTWVTWIVEEAYA